VGILGVYCGWGIELLLGGAEGGVEIFIVVVVVVDVVAVCGGEGERGVGGRGGR